MEVRIWQSFSCNNSSSYKLVARFKEAKLAEAAAEELRAFFAEHAQQIDDSFDDGQGFTLADEPTPAALALAEKHGVTWKDGLIWGDESPTYWLPTVAAVGPSLMIYHGYCGGFGDDLPKVLAALGAECEPEDTGQVAISVRFSTASPEARAVADELAPYFAQAAAEDRSIYLNEWPIQPPWQPKGDPGYDEWDQVAFFDDGQTCGFVTPFHLDDVSALRGYLEGKGVSNYHIELDEEDAFARYQAVSMGHCPECDVGGLRFLDAAEHGTESDQVACPQCGGMFDIGAIEVEER